MTPRRPYLRPVPDAKRFRLPLSTLITGILAVTVVWGLAAWMGYLGVYAVARGQVWPAAVTWACALFAAVMGLAWWPRRDPTR